MPGKVRNRLKVLVAEKELEESRRISYQEIRASIKERTGVNIASSTLSKWANNEIERYDSITLAILCDYFRCEIGNLLEYISFTD